MKILKYSGLVCALGMLAGCSGGEPSKEEVKDYIIQQGLSQAFLFQHPSVEQRAKAVEQLNKAVDLQSYECKAVEGFKKSGIVSSIIWSTTNHRRTQSVSIVTTAEKYTGRNNAIELF